MSFMTAIRNMGGYNVSTVSLSWMKYGEMEFDSDKITKVSNAVVVGFRDFAPIYCEHVNRSSYSLEQVFHDAVLSRFDEMWNMDGLDIIYDDVTLHMRILVNGEGSVRHNVSIEISDHVVSYNGSTVVVQFEQFRTDDHNEYWEYIVLM